MSAKHRTAALLLALAALALGAAGCGDDDSSDTSPSVPDITIPEGEAETTTEETITAPETTDGGSGGVTADPTKPDSATNDVPPEPDTPEARFEEFCKKNPGACG